MFVAIAWATAVAITIRMLSLAEWESKIAIGIIFEFALLAQLPVDSWDKPLHGICTESDCKIAQRKS